MLVSLEARVPLLDHVLMEYVATMPTALKLRTGGGKAIFKRAMADACPPRCSSRRKMGFGVPLAGVVPRRARGLRARRPAREPRARERGLLDPAAVAALLDEHRRGRRDRSSPALGAALPRGMGAAVARPVSDSGTSSTCSTPWGSAGTENGVVNVVNALGDESPPHRRVMTTGGAAGRPAARRAWTSSPSASGRASISAPSCGSPRLLRRLRPDIVHSRNWGAFDAVLAGPAGRRAGRDPRRARPRGVAIPEGPTRGATASADWLSPLVDRFVTVSRRPAALARRDASESPPRKVVTIHNGVDTARFASAASRSRPARARTSAGRRVVIGTVGRLDPVKDQAGLLDAFAAAPRAGPRRCPRHHRRRALPRRRSRARGRRASTWRGSGPHAGRAARRPARARRARRVHPALHRRGHLEHHPRGDGDRPAGRRHPRGRQPGARRGRRDRPPRPRGDPAALARRPRRVCRRSAPARLCTARPARQRAVERVRARPDGRALPRALPRRSCAPGQAA